MRYEVQAAWLTRTGLLAYNKQIGYFFCDNGGRFRRFSSKEEGENLEPQLHEITVNMTVTAPGKWRFLWSWRISDFTQHKPETCFNGGDYAFYETHYIFGRINAGELELLDVERYTTSAEFDYDEVHGAFQSGLGDVNFIDVEVSDFHKQGLDFYLRTQTGRDEYGNIREKTLSLNQVGSQISLESALTGVDIELVLDEKSNTGQTATHGKIQEEGRLQILKETFDWEPTKRR